MKFIIAMNPSYRNHRQINQFTRLKTKADYLFFTV
jgi:hypothetical protein